MNLFLFSTLVQGAHWVLFLPWAAVSKVSLDPCMLIFCILHSAGQTNGHRLFCFSLCQLDLGKWHWFFTWISWLGLGQVHFLELCGRCCDGKAKLPFLLLLTSLLLVNSWFLHNVLRFAEHCVELISSSQYLGCFSHFRDKQEAYRDCDFYTVMYN